jgi:Brp/Blh family beta-carotene 15,15'-monooxygenase
MTKLVSQSILNDERRGRLAPPFLFQSAEPKDPGSISPAILALTIVLLFALSLSSAALPMLIVSACVALLVIGLPHGMFDYLTLRKEGRGSWIRLAFLTAGYCGLAAIGFLGWQVAPTFSLVAFIVIAISHFMEDWAPEGSGLFALAMAISMIALPALLYSSQLSALFILVGGANAGAITDYMRLVAPVFGLIAVAKLIIDFGDGKSDQAWRNLLLLAATLLLPPGIGFAIFFCLYHSPKHFAAGRRDLMNQHDNPQGFFLYMSVSSAAVVLCVLLAHPLITMSERLIVTAFQTLSILTLPHMMLPHIIENIRKFSTASTRKR